MDQIRMRGEPLTFPVYYRNRHWAVTGYGIERCDGCYALGKLSFWELWDDGMPGLPRHIFEKGHPDYGTKREFMDAWLVAMGVHPRPPKAKPFPHDWYEWLCKRYPELEIER